MVDHDKHRRLMVKTLETVATAKEMAGRGLVWETSMELEMWHSFGN
jgi:hypothetical protein